MSTRSSVRSTRSNVRSHETKCEVHTWSRVARNYGSREAVHDESGGKPPKHFRTQFANERRNSRVLPLQVAGNFHFAPGKSYQQHHVHGECSAWVRGGAGQGQGWVKVRDGVGQGQGWGRSRSGVGRVKVRGWAGQGQGRGRSRPWAGRVKRTKCSAGEDWRRETGGFRSEDLALGQVLWWVGGGRGRIEGRGRF